MTYRKPEELMEAWMKPSTPGASKSMRDFLNEAYLRGRQDQEVEDRTEMDDRADELITRVEEVIGSFRQSK